MLFFILGTLGFVAHMGSGNSECLLCRVAPMNVAPMLDGASDQKRANDERDEANLVRCDSHLPPPFIFSY